MPDYGYLNARLHGMKSRLLSWAEYEKLLKAQGIGELTEMIGKTLLRPFLEKALVRLEGEAALEEAFKGDFVQASRKVLKVSEGEQRKLVRILLGRWDVFNVKTVLRGKHGGVSPQETYNSLIPAGELDTGALKSLADQPGVKEVVDLLATWGFSLAEPLVDNLDAYHHDFNLVRLELALDKAYFAGALRATRGRGSDDRLVREFLGSLIDIANVMAKVRLTMEDISTWVETKEEKAAREKKEAARRRVRAARPKIRREARQLSARERYPLPAIQDYFIQGGLETGGPGLEKLLRLRNMGKLLAFVSRTSFGHLVSAEMLELEKIPDTAAFERSMEMELIKRCTGLHRREPMGIAMAISFLWMKYNELVNLRIIGRGKEFNIPDNVLRNELCRAF